MMAWKDPYAILGVGRGAPLSEVKRAYRKLAFSLHPDVGDNPDEARFREARDAYQTLIQMDQRPSHRAESTRRRRTGLAARRRCTLCRAHVPSRFYGNLPST